MAVERVPSPNGADSLLGRIASQCVVRLDVTDAAIAVVTGPGRWVPTYATSPAVAQLEEDAYILGEGPCFDVLRDHAPVVVVDVAGPDALARWPAWSGAAAAAGIRSATALPIEAGAIAAGVFTVYSAAAGYLSGPRLTLARRYADVAFVALLDLGFSSADGNDETDVLAHLTGIDDRSSDFFSVLRADVHRAAGMIMVQADLPIDQALARLRAYAFSSARPLSDVAADVVARRVRFQADGTGNPGEQ